MYMTATCFIIVTVFADVFSFDNINPIVRSCYELLYTSEIYSPSDFETKKLTAGNMINAIN